MVWYSHLFQNFLQFVVIHTVKGSSIVNEAEVGIFSGILLLALRSGGCWQFVLWFLCISFSVSSFYIWKFLFHVLLKPSLKDFEHNLAIMWYECNCTVMRTFLWHCLSFDLE